MMMQRLPLNGFQWVQCIDQIDARWILDIPEDSPIGYLFEVDLKYPSTLHDMHKDYPMCAESMTVPGTRNDNKLMLTLHDKKNYVIHYRMLQSVLNQGLILEKVHRVLQFH